MFRKACAALAKSPAWTRFPSGGVAPRESLWQPQIGTEGSL